MGTQWYVGSQNLSLFSQYGTNTIVDMQGLEIIETAYAPNAGYINDNTIKKAHETRRIAAGLSRESVLFTFGRN
jgi:hypothetical protein